MTDNRSEQKGKTGEPIGLIVICGPTATGKSGVALELAQRLNTVILSADSRACYQEFDIGTAKPTIADRQRVPHYLIDICPPTDTLTVADYQHRAQSLIAQFHTPPPSHPPTLPLPHSPTCRRHRTLHPRHHPRAKNSPSSPADGTPIATTTV